MQCYVTKSHGSRERRRCSEKVGAIIMELFCAHHDTLLKDAVAPMQLVFLFGTSCVTGFLLVIAIISNIMRMRCICCKSREI
jgi:hypothetical protein